MHGSGCPLQHCLDDAELPLEGHVVTERALRATAFRCVTLAVDLAWRISVDSALEGDRKGVERRVGAAIVAWFEGKYHRQRAQDTLGGLTPIEFEVKLAETLPLAA